MKGTSGRIDRVSRTGHLRPAVVVVALGAPARDRM